MGDFIAALILGVVLAILSLKLIYTAGMDLTDIISPELVKQARQIVTNTEGVIELGPILMRRSGDTVFADITISLRADVSFDKAHEISNNVETNIKNKIPNAAITIHFEPNWKGVPRNSKVNDIVSSIDGVKEVHNISSYSSEGKVYLSLHVMVDQKINLDSAHKISEIIEEKIQREIPETEHVTIHLEPFVAIPKNLKIESKKTGEQINKLLNEYKEIKKIGRIVTLNFKDVLKIDIDISFEKNLSIEEVHDLTSQIERKIRNKFKNSIVQEFQHYDRLASSITRRVFSPRQDRYNWKATKKIDFQQLANHISEVSDNVWKLYHFIYQSKDLSILNESFKFGHTSLRRHLLIIANLIVQDYVSEKQKKDK